MKQIVIVNAYSLVCLTSTIFLLDENLIHSNIEPYIYNPLFQIKGSHKS